MSLQKLSNEQVEQNLKSLIQQERVLVSEIVNHVAEIERRKFYLGRAYPSLFEYLTVHLEYPKSSAQRVIDAARLMLDVPEISEKLESSELSMSQVTLVQKSIRQKISSTKDCKISKETKQALIEEISGLTVEESQRTVAQALDLEIKEATLIKIQKDGSVRFEITFSKEQWEKMQQLRELFSNSLPYGSWDQVLELAATKIIQQKTKLRSEKIKPSPNVTVAKKKANFKRNQCCKFTDPVTGKICGSRWTVQNDHIQPLWADGSNDLENLQLMCAKHNRYRYKQQAGLTSKIRLQNSPSSCL